MRLWAAAGLVAGGWLAADLLGGAPGGLPGALAAGVDGIGQLAGGGLEGAGPLAAGEGGGLAGLWREVNQRIIGLAASPWAVVACYLLAVIDGFFPPVPAETLIVATAAAHAASAPGTAAVWGWALGLWAVSAAGAVSGDCIAFTLGRWFNAPNWRVLRGRKGQTALAWARRVFARGAVPLLMVARFIPVGRVAVNLTAGTIGYPLRRFALVDSAAAACWAAYAVGIGFAAGHLSGDNPLLAVVVGVGFSATLGSLIQWLLNRHYDKVAPAQPPAQPSA
ncbi:MAG: VTT domain-containing protein [Bifidobacteriaceae bacterium]|jgi:membrane protein DedA with SNARE-associated domain|nr:VTT domain-containing protein [Bifidobacteriaceae bacterium]